MNIARYWATVDAEEIAPDGTPMPFSIRRGSDVSRDDARRHAEQAARELQRRIRAGEEPADSYDYSARQLAEPIIDEVHDVDGQRIGAITVNHYGCEVLNTLRLGFLDVDQDELRPRPRHADRRGFFARLFGGSRGEPAKPRDPRSPEERALDQLRSFITDHRGTGVRAYRTAGGLRYLFVRPQMDPKSALDVPIYAELGCDPLYRRLCVAQGCFRARLSPKPWRIGVDRPPRFHADATNPEFEEWRTIYRARSAGFAVCTLIDSFGETAPPDDMTRHLIDMHDELTGATTGYPLA